MSSITFDLIKHLTRQREFSRQAFGPGARTRGVIDHIRKELLEIEADPTDLKEWIDVVILAFDGALRAGYEPAEIAAAWLLKQNENEKRDWPDWRTADPDKAIEHLREQLRSKEPLRKDAKGNTIPWDKEHDHFMAFDPENPDLPMD